MEIAETKRRTEIIQLKELTKLRVETEYDSGLKTSNEVIDQSTSGASSKALRIDQKVHGKDIDKCKKAVHTIFDGETELYPQVETQL